MYPIWFDFSILLRFFAIGDHIVPFTLQNKMKGFIYFFFSCHTQMILLFLIKKCALQGSMATEGESVTLPSCSEKRH